MYSVTGIYKIEAENGAVYIGQTRNWNKRLQQYKSLNCKKQSKLFNSLAKYGWFHHEFEIIHEFSGDISPDILDTYEKLYIEQYKCNYLKYPESNGLNLTDGGREFSEKAHSDEVNLSRSNTLKGVSKSEEHKRKISETLKGRKLSEQHKENVRRSSFKKVKQYSLEGILIKEWDSVKEAEETLNIAHSSISACALGKLNKTGGYFWRY